jgi:hypothetical protein
VNQTYQDSIVLINTDGWCALHCRRIKVVAEPEVPLDFPFSLLPALEEGFFSDVTIIADNGKEVLTKHCSNNFIPGTKKKSRCSFTSTAPF